MSSDDRPASPLNRLSALWQADQAGFGVLLTMPSVQLTQLLARAGFDFLIVDLEHGPIDVASAHAMIAATAGTPAVPLVRVPENLPWLAKPVLDAGAMGIISPLICSRAEAEAAVRAVRYPPAGDRAWGPFYAPARWDLTMPRYMQVANDEVLASILIEHPEAIRQIDEIVSTPGLDLAIIGPFDLATSLGRPGQLDHPEVRSAIVEAESAILRSDVKLGGVAFSPKQANEMVERGYRLLTLGFDWSLLQRAAASVLEGIGR